MAAADAHGAIDAVWRIESPRLIAALARVVRDIGVAEDLAHDALVAALEQWPRDGVPRNPGAWLMAAAKHRAIDLFRRRARVERKHAELGYELGARAEAADLDAALDDDVGDDLLRLIFTACHPVLAPDARAALTLRLLGGLTTGEIARATRAMPSPIVELNRAVAVGMASAPAAGLAMLDAIAPDPALAGYPWLPSARGDLLFRLGRRAEARDAFTRAASLTHNDRDRALLLARAAHCDGGISA